MSRNPSQLPNGNGLSAPPINHREFSLKDTTHSKPPHRGSAVTQEPLPSFLFPATDRHIIHRKESHNLLPRPRSSIQQSHDMHPLPQSSIQQSHEMRPPPRSSIQQSHDLHPLPQPSIQQTHELLFRARSSIQQSHDLHRLPQSSIQQTHDLLSRTRSSIQQSHDMRPPPRSSIQQSHDMRPPPRSSIQQSHDLHRLPQSSIQQSHDLLPRPRSSIQQSHDLHSTTRSSIQQSHDLHPLPQSSIQQSHDLHSTTRSSIQQSHDLHPLPRSSIQQSHDLHPATRSSIQQSQDLHPATRSSIQQSQDLHPHPSYPRPPLPFQMYNGYTHFACERPPLQTPPPEVQPRLPCPLFAQFLESEFQLPPSRWPQRPPFSHMSKTSPQCSSLPVQQIEPIRGGPEPNSGPFLAIPNTPYPVAIHRNYHAPPRVANVLPTSPNNGPGRPVIRPPNMAPAASLHRNGNKAPQEERPRPVYCCPTQTTVHQNNGSKLDLYFNGFKEMLIRNEMDTTVQTPPGNIEPSLSQQSAPNTDTNSTGNNATTGNALHEPNPGNFLAGSPVVVYSTQSMVKGEVIDVDEDDEDCMLVDVDLNQRKSLDKTVIDLVDDNIDDNERPVVVKVEKQESSMAQWPVDHECYYDNVDDDVGNDTLRIANNVLSKESALVTSSVQVCISDPHLDDAQVMNGPPDSTDPSVNSPIDEVADNAQSNIFQIMSGLGNILQSISAIPKTNGAGPLATVNAGSMEDYNPSFNQFPGIHGDEIVISDSDDDDKGSESCGLNKESCARLNGVEVQHPRVSLNEGTHLSSGSNNDQRTTTTSAETTASIPTEIVDKNGHKGQLEKDASPYILKRVGKRGRPKKIKPKIDESLEENYSMPFSKKVVSVSTETVSKDGNCLEGQIVKESSLVNVKGMGRKCGHPKKITKQNDKHLKGAGRIALNNEIFQQIVDNEISKQIVDNETFQQIVDNEISKQIVDNETFQQIVDNEISKQIVDNETFQQIVDNETSKPLVDNDTSKQIVDNETSKQIVDNDTSKQIVDNETSKQIVDKSSISEIAGGILPVNESMSIEVNTTNTHTNNAGDPLRVADKKRSNELVRKECHMTSTLDVQSDLNKRTVKTVHAPSIPWHGSSPERTVKTVHAPSIPWHGSSPASGLMESSSSESDSDSDTSSNESESVASDSSLEEDAHIEYTCKVCSNTFGRKSHLKKHIKTHREESEQNVEKKIKCKSCRRKLLNKTSLQAHLLQHRYCFYDCTRIYWKPKSSSTKSCRICHKSFDRLNNLKRHSYKHLTCRLEFINLVLDKIKQHPKDVDGNTKHDVMFKDKSTNQNVISDHEVPEASHISKGHQGLATEPIAAPRVPPPNVQDGGKYKRSESYLCKSCQHDFETPRLFRDHLNVKDSCKLFYLQPDNTSPVSLNYCPSCCIFMSCQFKLLSHQCLGEKTVTKCLSCSRLFNTSFGLRQHLKKSTCSPRSLEQAKGNTSSKTALKKVVENAIGIQVSVPLSSLSQVVKSDDTERHECLLCPKMFLQVRGLLEHSYSHTEEGRFQCQDCSMVFNRYNSSVSHTIWHRRNQELVNDKEDNSSVSSSKKKPVAELSAESVTKRYPSPKRTINFKRKADVNVNKLKHKFPKPGKGLSYLKANKFHADPNDALFSCSSCGQQFPTWKSRNYHLETCVRCQGKTTSRGSGASYPVGTDERSNAKASIKRQSNLFNKCILCPKSLLKASLKSHLKTHVQNYSRFIRHESTMPLITPLFFVRNTKSTKKPSDLNVVKKVLKTGLNKNAMIKRDNTIDISSQMSSIADVRIHPRIEVDNGGMNIISCQSETGMQYAPESFHRECSICGDPLSSKVQSWKHQFKHVTPCSVVAFKLENVLREVRKDYEYPANSYGDSVSGPVTHLTNLYHNSVSGPDIDLTNLYHNSVKGPDTDLTNSYHNAVSGPVTHLTNLYHNSVKGPDTNLTNLYYNAVKGPDTNLTNLYHNSVKGPDTNLTNLYHNAVKGPDTDLTNLYHNAVKGPDTDLTNLYHNAVKGTDTDLTNLYHNAVRDQDMVEIEFTEIKACGIVNSHGVQW